MSVCSSANSISPPVGMPRARRVIFCDKPLSSPASNEAFRSPMVVGERAIIISLSTPVFSVVFLSTAMRALCCISRLPAFLISPTIKYLPVNDLAFSSVRTSVSFSTTATIVWSRFGSAQIEQSGPTLSCIKKHCSHSLSFVRLPSVVL